MVTAKGELVESAILRSSAILSKDGGRVARHPLGN